MNWDTIFTAGTHTDSKGRERSWTVADLDRLVANTTEKVPVVIRHPAVEENAAHFGHICRLRRVGEKLEAKYQDVPETLRRAVSDGLRLQKSVSIDTGKMISGDNDMTPEETIGELRKEIEQLKAERKNDAASKELAELRKKLEDEQAAHEKTRTEFQKYRDDQDEAALAARVTALAESGRILPAEKEKITSFAKAMDAATTTMEFAKADGEVEKISPREAWLRDLENREPVHKSLTTEFAKDGGRKQQDEAAWSAEMDSKI